MSDNDIMPCFEYLGKQVEDEEFDIIMYQVEQDESGALPTSTLSKKETPNNATPKSIRSKNKNTAACGKTLIVKKHNTKMEKLTNDNDQTITSKLREFSETERKNINDPDVPVKTNDSDDANCDETETKIKNTSSPKPLGRYQCMMCPYNNDKKHRLKRHLTMHSDERPYKCSVCEKAFKCENNLKKHINRHTDTKPFQCVDCDKAFVSTADLGYHKKLYHSGMKPIKCTECDYSTVDSVRMKRHKSIHMDERPFKCSHCTYSSTNTVRLKTHMKIHTEEKRYECDICNSRFREAYLLRNHREIHITNGKNVFQCNRCSSKLRTRATLRIHMQQVHNELIPNKPHSCPHCDRAFTLKARLLRHIDTHDPSSNQATQQLNLKRTARVRSDAILKSKLKLINEDVEEDEKDEEEN